MLEVRLALPQCLSHTNHQALVVIFGPEQALTVVVVLVFVVAVDLAFLFSLTSTA